MMSAFFKTATIAALSGIVAYLASFLPFMVGITLENEMSFVHKVLSVRIQFFPNFFIPMPIVCSVSLCRPPFAME